MPKLVSMNGFLEMQDRQSAITYPYCSIRKQSVSQSRAEAPIFDIQQKKKELAIYLGWRYDCCFDYWCCVVLRILCDLESVNLDVED